MEKHSNKTNPTNTVLTICIGILVVYLITDLRWLLYLAAALGIIGVFSTRFCILIDYLWMKLAWLLSFTFPVILLSLVFFMVVFPISLLSKLFSRTDNLMVKNRRTSLLVDTGKEFTPSSFEKLW